MTTFTSKNWDRPVGPFPFDEYQNQRFAILADIRHGTEYDDYALAEALISEDREACYDDFAAYQFGQSWLPVSGISPDPREYLTEEEFRIWDR